MEDLLTNITGLDMALCLALLFIYVWRAPEANERREGLDTRAID